MKEWQKQEQKNKNRKTTGIGYRETKGNELSARYKTKTYFIQFMLYTAREESKRTKIKSKPAFKHRRMVFYTKTYDNLVLQFKHEQFQQIL